MCMCQYDLLKNCLAKPKDVSLSLRMMNSQEGQHLGNDSGSLPCPAAAWVRHTESLCDVIKGTLRRPKVRALMTV